jgi:hypothetical protein
MVKIWVFAAGAVALAALALARLARRRTDSSTGTLLTSVSEEWLSDLRGQGPDGP